MDMKKIVSLFIAALVAASFSALAQNNTEVLQQAQQQVQEKRDALDDAERAHRQPQAGSASGSDANVPSFSADTSSAERQRLKKYASSILSPFGYEAYWLHGEPMAKFFATAAFTEPYIFVPFWAPST